MKNMKRYRSLDSWLRARHGEKVQKIPLDAGSGCPNRDGTLAAGGCTFCNALGSGSGRARESFAAQWDYWHGRHARSPRTKNVRLFLGYIQSFTNTYGPASRLASLLAELEGLPGLAGASVGTRPDCVDEEKMALMAAAPWPEFWLELGAQSCRDSTLRRINRGHSAADTERAVHLAAQHGVNVCLHLMAGLPGERGDDFLETVRWAASLPIQGVKLHNLYVPHDTALEQEWARGGYRPMEQEEYVELAARALTILPSTVVMHRLCADPAPGELAAPAWAMDKGITVMHLDRLLAYNDWWQGKRCDAPDANPFAQEAGADTPR
ncbi:TIGR01212 family radical SAM protein [Mailhella sp.]|uniref:TIGR01212 family radical SAM protein n=1 Tax=Mailhella sp. TaxID=1981029 RepID=UPI0040647FC2